MKNEVILQIVYINPSPFLCFRVPRLVDMETLIPLALKLIEYI